MSEAATGPGLMNDQKISVVIPCFNAAAYLGEALDSVFAQGHSNIEVIVVDDGSTDDSHAVACSFGDHVTCLQQENQGISAARNTGLRASNGSLIGFLDADDIWTADSLASRIAAKNANPDAGCVFGAVEQFVSPDVPADERDEIFCPPEPRTGRLAGSMLVDREVFDRVGLFDPAFGVGETMDWVARSDAAGIRSVGIDQVVLRRRIHASNSVRKTEALQRDYLRVIRASLTRRREDAKQ